MAGTLKITHRAGIDALVEIGQHSNSANCPGAMLEINPAFGCQFRCAYCGIYALEKDYFGELIVYDDYPEYLDDYLSKNPATIEKNYFYFSAKTDCLQPALIESGITLKILRILQKHGARHFLVTKGGLPPEETREALVDAKDINQVIISATVSSEKWRETLEPGAAPIADRLDLARFCLENGIFTTASCCPVLPLDDRSYLIDVIRRFAAAGVKHFYFDFARLSRDAVANMSELLPEHREDFERHYFTPEARVSSWHMPHRDVTIDKYQPPERFMLDAFEELSERVREIAPEATVSICNHFATPKTLSGFNNRARAECIACMGQRF